MKRFMAVVLALGLCAPEALSAPRRRPAATPDAAAQSVAPCARGTWKDDPACFGENDPNRLPTPSSAGQSEGLKSEGGVAPALNANRRAGAPSSVHQPNGDAATTGQGGLRLPLPF